MWIRSLVRSPYFNDDAGVGNRGVDVLGYIWAQICKRASTNTEIVLKLGGDSTKKIAVKVVRATQESLFYQNLHYFGLVVVSLGIATSLVVSNFFRDVVFDNVNRGLCSWKVAQEFMCLQFRRIAEDHTKKTTLSNVYQSGQQDTYLREAKANADAFFRTRAGNALGDDGDDEVPKKYNGRFDSNAAKPCISFNLGQKHQAKHLDDTGCCKFNHVCMQWVSDKGPRGMCLGNHAKKDCTYDASKKLDRPAN